MRHYGAHCELKILTARDTDGCILGIAPLMMGYGQRHGRKLLRHLTFVGCLCDSLAEYLDFLILPEHAEAVTAAFCGFLSEKHCFEADCIFLPMMEETSPTPHLVKERLGNFGPLEVLNRYPARHATLPGTWDAYFGTREAKFRQQIRSKSRFFQEMGATYLEGGKDISVAEAMADLVDLNKKRWSESNTAFARHTFDAFHRELAEEFARHGWLSLHVLRRGTRPISARYDFVYRGKVWGYQGGWDPEFANAKPGQVMFAHVIRHAIEAYGATEFDFMAGGGDYQRWWVTGERTLLDLEILNMNEWRGWVYRNLRTIHRNVGHLEKVATF
jgi:hypothetical protein